MCWLVLLSRSRVLVKLIVWLLIFCSCVMSVLILWLGLFCVILSMVCVIVSGVLSLCEVLVVNCCCLVMWVLSCLSIELKMLVRFWNLFCGLGSVIWWDSDFWVVSCVVLLMCLRGVSICLVRIYLLLRLIVSRMIIVIVMMGMKVFVRLFWLGNMLMVLGMYFRR